MKKAILTLTASLFAVLAPAQNLISSGSPLYKLPYKNTYVMQTLVAENTFRTAKVEKPKPGTFEQARKVLPSPYWEGHPKEMEMYWKAWQIGLKNVCQPLDDSGFVTSYISPAYNGNIFMWDDAFITMFCRYGDRFFPFQKTLDNFYAKQHPDGFICREIRADGSVPENHAHHQIQDELMQECEYIKRQLPISSFLRPAWDLETLSRIGVEEFSFDLGISKRIYTEKDEFYNPTPMFLIFAKKQG